MKLLTKELVNTIPPLYSQEHVKDPVVWVRLFHPLSSWKFYVLEYNPAEKLFFGWNPMDKELGYASLEELESTVVRGLGIERDMYFDPKPLSWVKAGKDSDSYTLSTEEKKIGRKTSAKRPKVKRPSTKSAPSGFGGIR